MAIKTMKFYFAYGSNLNVGQMRVRCPRARKFETLVLPGWRLVFRGVADIERARGARVHGGLWLITPACEAALDRYEGVRSGLYTKETFPITYRDTKTNKREHADVLFYKMRDDGYAMPSGYYLSVIADGYRDFGLDLAHLDAALDWTEERIPVEEPRLNAAGDEWDPDDDDADESPDEDEEEEEEEEEEAA